MIGVLLAGGEGRRVGGEKALLELCGRPLILWAYDALAAVADPVVVACRLDSRLPTMPGVREAWVEPEGPRGPLAGIVSALREAGGRPILVLSISRPLVRPELLGLLAAADAGGRPAVVPQAAGRLEPLVARYGPEALPLLAGLPPSMDTAAAVASLKPAMIPILPEDASLLDIGWPEDLLRAGALLDARRRAAVRA